MDIVIDHASAIECVPGSPFHPYTKAMYVQVGIIKNSRSIPLPPL